MKTFLLSLALFLLCSAGQALKISKLEFEADFPIDSIALATLSGIVPGTEFDALTVSSALDKLNQHFIRESRYYVRIPFPELIPADDGTLTLHFTLSQILDTTQAYLRYSGNRYFTSAKLH
ncbi:MAG TPA: hypothetical protein PKI59_04250, partial [Candidatus Cloacimonadota bacterium]|nr:hypothetical protein [Candidatus Cloacimonadota bacterium]